MAGLLTEVCHSMGVEPMLHPLNGKQLSYRSANVEYGARLDVVSEGFWDHRQSTHFDVKASLWLLSVCHRWAELEKR